ncbi:MAG: hypothetical protein HQ530_03630 [Parcubacteria group bacterium]|nr:hypothetical protein [Parcubacteria group bacterium]
MKYSKCNQSKGSTIVELIVAIAAVAIIFSMLGSTIVWSLRNAQFGGNRERATMLANEGLEAARNIRDADFVNLADGTHGLAIASNEWTLSGSQDITDNFTRETVISTIDANTKEVTSTVTWDETSQRPGSVTSVTRFNDWQIVTAPPVCDWTIGIGQIGSYDLPANKHGLKVQAAGDYAYMVRNGGNPDLVVFNVSNLASPTIEGSLDLPNSPTNIAVSGNYAYVSSKHNSQELQVVDISNPVSPSVVGTYDAAEKSDAGGIYVDGNYVYLVKKSSKKEELFIINISNPVLPSLVGSLNLGASANEVVVLGNYAYVASEDNSQELQVIDISSLASPSLIGSYDLTGNDDSLTVTGFGSTVILGRKSGGVHIFDVSTPATPVELGWYDAGSQVNDLSLGNSNNYVAIGSDDNTSEFQLVDISTPASPSLIHSFDASNNINGVFFSDDKCATFVVGQTNNTEFMILIPQ